MKNPRRFEFIEGTPATFHPTPASIAATACMIAMIAAISLSASPGPVALARVASAQPSVSAPPDETAYFPAAYVNRGVEVPAHIDAF